MHACKGDQLTMNHTTATFIFLMHCFVLYETLDNISTLLRWTRASKNIHTSTFFLTSLSVYALLVDSPLIALRYNDVPRSCFKTEMERSKARYLTMGLREPVRCLLLKWLLPSFSWTNNHWKRWQLIILHVSLTLQNMQNSRDLFIALLKSILRRKFQRERQILFQFHIWFWLTYRQRVTYVPNWLEQTRLRYSIGENSESKTNSIPACLKLIAVLKTI